MIFEFNNVIKFQEKKNDVLLIGELLIDMISSDYCENFECDTFNKFFGGSPANIAINTKKLGIRSIVSSAVGGDGLGDFLIKTLENSGINSDYVTKVNYSTSMVLITKSKSTPIPIFYREADYHLEYNEYLKEAIRNSKILHFSCWPISRQPSRNTIEKSIKEAKDNNVLICFDPNYHPMIWEKEENGVEYIKSIIKYVDIVKPSEDDANRLFGEDSPKNQVEKFLKLGAKLVIMTLGKDGAIVSNGDKTIEFKTLATDVIDTTGAGDAFWSGFYTSLIKGYSLEKALQLGFAVSAYNLKHTGAIVELPKLEEIKKIYTL